MEWGGKAPKGPLRRAIFVDLDENLRDCGGVWATQYRGGGLGGYGGLGLMPTKGIRADAALLVPLVVRGHGSLSVASTQWRL